MVQSGAVEIFFNARGPAVEEYPALANMPIGGTLTLYIEVSAVAKIYDELKGRVKVTMPLEKKFYGVTEFAFEDPDGYVITFARRISRNKRRKEKVEKGGFLLSTCHFSLFTFHFLLPYPTRHRRRAREAAEAAARRGA